MPQAQRPKLQVFMVKCVQCGGHRWPYLLERPEAYRCQLCRETSKAIREKRSASAQRGQATRRKRKSPPPT